MLIKLFALYALINNVFVETPHRFYKHEDCEAVKPQYENSVCLPIYRDETDIDK